jgi:hypothetical protein
MFRVALRNDPAQKTHREEFHEALACSFVFCSPILHSCSTFRKLGSAISRSAASTAVKTSRHQWARCRIPGLPRSVHSAERREAIFHLRSFAAVSRTNSLANRCDQWCSDGRNEASNSAGTGSLGGEDARADANEIDTGHCRRYHSGRSSGAGSGYKPPFSSSHLRGVRECKPGADDS